jgi:hypothetical protein
VGGASMPGLMGSRATARVTAATARRRGAHTGWNDAARGAVARCWRAQVP